MKKMQGYAKKFHKEMGWEISGQAYETAQSSLLNNYMLLTTEVAEVAEELRRTFNMTNNHINEGIDKEEAFRRAKESVKEDIGKEMADCLAYITKIANYLEIDLEDSFYQKMEEVRNRKNRDIAVFKKY
ncbi:MazG-like family protein [Aquibacillus salsiterrae]|uniref:MazG-like family protein n=1 Tax=Aquibacillus salsiterrae TaxID=2950439 RepID=A0A9X3WG31_9BACI|nr:MazG-like family protein [Aquibacillus salsiterrae]MDC3418008.1 MazG-like family protein [Aquibacillus salsiterrae]